MLRDALCTLKSPNRLYEASLTACEGGDIALVRVAGVKYIAVQSGALYDTLAGDESMIGGEPVKLCPLTHENAVALRTALPHLAPSPVLRLPHTIGLGDRLGIATAGHARVAAKYGFAPVFAQQSMRELTLCERSYESVLDDATFGVLEAGYTGPWGADGDHLKTAKNIEYALACGYTMVTLDLSDNIDNGVFTMSDADVMAAYNALPEDDRRAWETRYLRRMFQFADREIAFTPESLARTVLIYARALDFACDMYDRYFRDWQNSVDFELSIDETVNETSLEAHLFVAEELRVHNVTPVTVAPHFCGEFQKGIDYIGAPDAFYRDYLVHEAIARQYGYKLSIHSGSDKFSVFPVIGELSERFHVKTAGTNYLEALRVVSMCDAALFRELFAFCFVVYKKALQYYHITANLSDIPNIDELPDNALPSLFYNPAARQLMHIAYGFILTDKDSDGHYRFRERFFDVLAQYEDVYSTLLERHIGRHAVLLGLEASR